MRLCVLFICLCWQRLSLIVVCLLETAAGDVSLSSAEPLQLFSIHRGLCWRVALSVCAVWRNSRTSPSANRSLCLTHDRRITLAGPAVSAPVCVCVGYEKVCVCVCVSECQICQQSSLLNLKHTHTHARGTAVVAHRPGLYIMKASFSPSCFDSSHLFPLHRSLLSFYFHVILRVFCLPPFFSSPLPNLIPFPFLLSFPPAPLALLLPSRPSWRVQWDGNGRAVACVCARLCLSVWCHTTAAL